MMPLAVVGGFDESVLSWFDWLTWIFSYGAATACVDACDKQRNVACVGEMERISNDFALKDSAEFVFRLVESDDWFFARRLFRRLRIVDQLGWKLAVVVVAATRQQAYG